MRAGSPVRATRAAAARLGCALENDERVDGGDPAHGVVAYGVRHEQRVGQRVDGVEKQSRERREDQREKEGFAHASVARGEPSDEDEHETCGKKTEGL